jgi:hypothetical protein
MTSTYEMIATTTLGSDSGSVTFSSISGSYTDLVLVANFGVTGSGSTFSFQVGNGSVDTGSNYSCTRVYTGGVNGTTAISDRSSSASNIQITPSFGFNNVNISNNAIFQFQNYSNTTTNKTVILRANNGGGANGAYPGTGAIVGLWRSTSAINTMTFTGESTSFKTGSMFTLYGIKAE